MGSSQQFSLRWNNYLNHITGAFDTLRNDDELVDVTLSCEGKRIKAHKMLLSVCSTYFRDLFKENPCQHPVIIFRNVKFEDLVALIDFMYHGEVNVMQEQLTSFLTTAELLAVQGLSEDKGKDKEDDSPLADTEVDLTDSPPPAPVHETETSVSNSSHVGLMRHNRQRTSSPRSPPQAPAFFPSTSNVERRPDSPPNKRRRWLSSQQPITKPPAASVASRKGDDEGSRSSPPPPPSPARRPVTEPTPETSEIAPPAPNPSVKMEMPDYVDESRTRGDQGQMPSATSVENDSLASMAQLVATKTEGASSPTQGVSSAPPDLSDLYGGSSRDAGATSDSLSAAELSQILSKPGPSGESQSQDSLQGLHGILYHTGESSSEARMYSCEICGAAYRYAKNLSSHKKIHSGETVCKLCNKILSRTSNFQRHMRLVHGHVDFQGPDNGSGRFFHL